MKVALLTFFDDAGFERQANVDRRAAAIAEAILDPDGWRWSHKSELTGEWVGYPKPHSGRNKFPQVVNPLLRVFAFPSAETTHRYAFEEDFAKHNRKRYLT